MAALLSDRWWTMKPHPAGEAYSNSPHRFNTVPAGRRSTKTERLKRKVVKRAFSATTSWGPRYFLAAPTRDQAKRIFWEDMKALVGYDMMRKAPSETDLIIYTINGADICVIGLDKPQRMEGIPWDGGGVTEVGNIKETAWPQNIRPTLSDRNGWCDLEGVPEGRNHYYELDTKARTMMQLLGDKSEWGSYTWPSRDILPEAEIEAAQRDLDELTFQQEYEASFVSFEGRAYYPFTAATHTALLGYDPKSPLVFCFDFNVEPGVCAVIQEQKLPNQFLHDTLLGLPQLDKPIVGTGVISEVHIPRNSNTPAVCRKLIADFGKHEGSVHCYGDPTGGNRGTAKVSGSDWDLIETELKPVFRDRLSFFVNPGAGPERPRINATNSRLKSKAGDIRLMVDPVKAPHVVTDYEGVVLLKGGSGELDKKATPLLTHLSDAIGYYLDYKFPIGGASMVKVRLGGV